SLLTAKLYESHTVRQSMAKILKPLEREGIDLFAAGKDGQAQAIVRSEELKFFIAAAAQDEETLSDNVTENVWLQIESAAFKEGHKWRFSDGSVAFHAEIADEDFLARINAGWRFGKRDVLRVDLQRIHSLTDNGLKLRHIITRVHEHRGPLQA
ncbi:hypothetical protein, partial [Ventosimonas gracilis]|uniref:hypothetical protein n=1 Tax=Ventosimonas gracilis TaxID=1680762 RepID=UPI001EFB13F9